MEFNFDKEMDALLRQSAQGETAFAKNPKSEIRNPKSVHLDADEIAAFAENALPEKTKSLYTLHFADCDRCRKILANVIASSSEILETETAAKEIRIAAPRVAEIPWYKKNFSPRRVSHMRWARSSSFSPDCSPSRF